MCVGALVVIPFHPPIFLVDKQNNSYSYHLLFLWDQKRKKKRQTLQTPSGGTSGSSRGGTSRLLLLLLHGQTSSTLLPSTIQNFPPIPGFEAEEEPMGTFPTKSRGLVGALDEMHFLATTATTTRCGFCFFYSPHGVCEKREVREEERRGV